MTEEKHQHKYLTQADIDQTIRAAKWMKNYRLTHDELQQVKEATGWMKEQIPPFEPTYTPGEVIPVKEVDGRVTFESVYSVPVVNDLAIYISDLQNQLRQMTEAKEHAVEAFNRQQTLVEYKDKVIADQTGLRNKYQAEIAVLQAKVTTLEDRCTTSNKSAEMTENMHRNVVADNNELKYELNHKHNQNLELAASLNKAEARADALSSELRAYRDLYSYWARANKVVKCLLGWRPTDDFYYGTTNEPTVEEYLDEDNSDYAA